MARGGAAGKQFSVVSRQFSVKALGFCPFLRPHHFRLSRDPLGSAGQALENRALRAGIFLYPWAAV